MAVVKITIRDVGKNKDGQFEVSATSYPDITDEQVADITKLSLAQYAALRVMEFIRDGLEVKPKRTNSEIFKNAHKSDKGLH